MARYARIDSLPRPMLGQPPVEHNWHLTQGAVVVLDNFSRRPTCPREVRDSVTFDAGVRHHVIHHARPTNRW
jgi:hypothetical protein